jgi:hypothetical protein
MQTSQIIRTTQTRCNIAKDDTTAIDDVMRFDVIIGIHNTLCIGIETIQVN